MATNPTIQFKRKTSAAGAPASLSAGEPAFNTVENFLYVGNGSAVKWVGAEILDHTTTAFTSTTSLATRKAIGDIFAPLRSPVFTGTITGNNVVLAGDIAVNGGDITSTSSTFNLLASKTDGFTLNIGPNTGFSNTTTINIGATSVDGATTDINIGHGYSGTRNGNITISSKAVTIGAGAGITIDTSSIGTDTATTFNLLNSTVTNANIFGAAATFVVGASGSGTASIRNATTRFGGTSGGATIATQTTSGLNHLSIIPSGNLRLSATRSDLSGLGTQGTITIVNGSGGTATSVSGAPLLLGDYADSFGNPQPGELRILESGGSNYTGFKAQAMSSDYIYTLPSAFPGSSGYVLQSDTSGNMSWAAPASSANVGVTATSASTNYKMIFTDVNASNTSAALFIDTTSGIVFNPSANNLTVAGSVYANASLYLGATSTGLNKIYIPETDPTGGFAINELANDIDHIYIEKQFPGAVGPFNNVYYMKVGDATTYGGYDAFPVGQPINVTDYESNVSSFVNIGAGGYLAATNTGYSYYKTINIGPDTGTGKTTYINLGAVNGTSSNLTTVYGAMSVTGNISTNQNLVVNGGTVTSTATTFNLLNTTVTNANVLGDLRTLSIGNNTTTGQVVNMFTNAAGTSTYNFATGNIANGSTKTINIGSNSGVGTTNVNIGAAGSGTSGKTVITSGVVDINSNTISSNATVLSLFATNLTVQGFHNAGTLSLGATIGNATIRNASTNINGTLTVTGATVIQGALTLNSSLTVTGATTFQGALSTNSTLSVTSNATFGSNIIVNGGNIQTTSSTFNLVTNTASVINIGTTSGSSINIGNGGSTTQFNGNIEIKGASDTSTVGAGSSTNVNLFNTTVTGMNIGASADIINIGSSNSTTYFAGGVDIANAKSFTVNGTAVLSSSSLGTTVTNSSLTRIDSSNLTLTGDLAVNGGDVTSTATTFNLLNSTVTGLNIGGGANTVNIGSTTAVINLGTGTNGATVNVKGNLVVDGSTTTVNSTTVTIDDLNIVLADGQTTAAGVDGAGISLGTSGITWNYVHGGGTFANWTSTENLDLTTGKSYKIGNQSVLSSSTLGPSVVTSSLTQVGTIATGTWRGSVIAANWGGTGFGTYTVGQLLYADTTTSLAKLTAAATPGSLLASNGAGVAPEYKFISLTNGTVTSSSGTLTLAIQNAAADGSTKGLASFNSTQFDDSSGLITLDTIDGGTYA